MVRPVIAAALALAVTAGARAEFDLTPSESSYEVEGIRVPNVTFRNGAKKIAYTPPAGWKLSGGASKLSLAPLDIAQAGATMQVVATREPSPATAENLKTYVDLATSLAPREATRIEVVEALVCPMRISGKGMIEVTLAYSFFGQQFRMNLLFLPVEKEQLRFQFVARASDFPALLKNFRSSLYSMQGL